MSRWRSWCLFLGLSVGAVAAGCTSKNPAATCSQGTCIDPNFPYCDLDGSIGGEPGTCIAVTCMAGVFEKCDGDAALLCNQFGNGYAESRCSFGCDASRGCNLCAPNMSACTNGVTAVCGPDGEVVSQTVCDLGCFDNEPRCRKLVASNGVDSFFDAAQNPPDLDLTSAYFDTMTGQVMDGATTIPVPSFGVFPSGNAGPLRVFIAHNVRIGNATAGIRGTDSRTPSGPAMILLALGDVTINGTFALAATSGGVNRADCNGGAGNVATYGARIGTAASGGGGNTSPGGAGGKILTQQVGGGGGALITGESLEPLHGGCMGGASTQIPFGGAGGGAIQITSRTKITINGVVDASGSRGEVEQYAQTSGYDVTGGGAGGSVLLEAPVVELGPDAQLLTPGGDGGAGCTVASATCGLGGPGSTGGTTAADGHSITYSTTADAMSSGGGGGGGGRIRINTGDGSYVKASTTVVNGALTTSVVHGS